MFLGKTPYSHSASLQPGEKIGIGWGNPASTPVGVSGGGVVNLKQQKPGKAPAVGLLSPT